MSIKDGYLMSNKMKTQQNTNAFYKICPRSLHHRWQQIVDFHHLFVNTIWLYMTDVKDRLFFFLVK